MIRDLLIGLGSEGEELLADKCGGDSYCGGTLIMPSAPEPVLSISELRSELEAMLSAT